MIGIYYGSTTGNTADVAEAIGKRLSGDVEVMSVTELSAEGLAKFDTLLFGSSTWGVGDLQDDWEEKLEVLKAADLSGKKVGFFGCGDQEAYPDSFADALGIIYRAVQDSGAKFIGEWPTEGYNFDESQAVFNDNFIGLVLDEDNQSELTEDRIADWTATLS